MRTIIDTKNRKLDGNYSKLKLIFYFTVLGVIFYWGYFLFTNEERIASHQKEICYKYRDMEFNGTISSCFIDHSNKGTYSFKILGKEDTLTLWYFGNSYLEVGDSIIKESGKTEYVIFKKNYSDSVKILKFSCEK